MKIILLTVLAAFLPAAALAQGLVDFNNFKWRLGLDGRVFVPSSFSWWPEPVGDAFYGQLYAGPTADSLAPIGVAVRFRNMASGLGSGRIFGPGAVVVPTVPSGQEAYVQLRAWRVADGATYEQAASKGEWWHGFSNIIKVRVDGGVDNPSGSPADLLGLTHTVIPIPEPSATVLGLLGAAALLLRRRAG